MILDDKPLFAGMRVIVTGGGAGIGRAVAQAFADSGAVVGVMDRDLSNMPSRTEPLRADVRSDEGVQAVLQEFGERHGAIDVLVANAGVSYPATVEDGPMSDWLGLLDLNVLGYVRAIRFALPYLRKSPGGASIINMSSCTAATGLRRRVLYSASKGAIEAMTRALAADLIHEGIRVNCVSPGTVDTPLIGKLIDAAPDPQLQRQVYMDRQPTGLMVQPDEVARAVLYLADPRAKSTVGTVLTVDGGLASLRLFDS